MLPKPKQGRWYALQFALNLFDDEIPVIRTPNLTDTRHGISHLWLLADTLVLFLVLSAEFGACSAFLFPDIY